MNLHHTNSLYRWAAFAVYLAASGIIVAVVVR